VSTLIDEDRLLHYVAGRVLDRLHRDGLAQQPDLPALNGPDTDATVDLATALIESDLAYLSGEEA
jgi:hypothetical protein